MNKRKSVILVSVIGLVAVLSVAFLVTLNSSPSTEDATLTDDNEPTAPADGSFPFNSTRPEGDFNFTAPDGNFTIPDGDFNFTLPEGGFNSTFPGGDFNFTAPRNGFNSTFPFMDELTEEQAAIVNEKMQELSDAGATQDEIMAAIQELMEEFETQSPE